MFGLAEIFTEKEEEPKLPSIETEKKALLTNEVRQRGTSGKSWRIWINRNKNSPVEPTYTFASNS